MPTTIHLRHPDADRHLATGREGFGFRSRGAHAHAKTRCGIDVARGVTVESWPDEPTPTLEALADSTRCPACGVALGGEALRDLGRALLPKPVRLADITPPDLLVQKRPCFARSCEMHAKPESAAGLVPPLRRGNVIEHDVAQITKVRCIGSLFGLDLWIATGDDEKARRAEALLVDMARR